MTIRNLGFLFNPESITLIGASKQASSVGAVVARNLLQGGFDGPIMPVNPSHRFIQSVWTYPDVASLPITPELAIIVTPADQVPEIISQLGQRGTRAAVVISAGFGEAAGEQGKQLQQTMLDAAKPWMLRIIGPNCLGILVPSVGLNASFAHITPQSGHLAFVAQSGAIVTSIIDWAQARSIGFSHLVSLGGSADVDFADMLDYLANDRKTKAILLYIEAISNARKFMSAARAAARMKPVLVVKAGRYAESARAVSSHTGALTGTDAVYDTAFRRAGMLRVSGLDELFNAAETLATVCRPKGERLAILTNGGGMGVLATDAIVEHGAQLVKLSQQTIDALNNVLPLMWSHGNPVDIIGDAPASRYAAALAILSRDSAVDAVLVINCPTAIASSDDAAQAVVDTATCFPDMTYLTSWVGDGSAIPARQLFARHHIPTYETPVQAVCAFMHVINYRRNQQTLMETPSSIPEKFTTHPEQVKKTIEGVLNDHRAWLSEAEAKAVLSAYDIPVAASQLAKTPEQAAALASAISGPVVVKIVSPDITHKSDAGGVALDIDGPEAVLEIAQAMKKSILMAHPAAKLSGFNVQPMIKRPDAYELIIGISEDPKFGPTILFGHGGTAVEIIKDQALALPPLNMRLAREVISHTRIYKLLLGYRGFPGADLDAIALTLIKVAQLVIDHPEIKALDINPLLADECGVIALDARINVAKTSADAIDRLAIQPYPKAMEEHITLGDGRTLLLRPIRPEDEPSLQATFSRLTPEEVRLRFFIPMKTLSHVVAVRFTQLDYEREMGLILTEPGIPGKTPVYGVANLVTAPDGESAEYAIILHHDLTALGLGIFLMKRIIDYAQRRDIRAIHGDVLRENAQMLKLCQLLGFTRSVVTDEPELFRVTLTLCEDN